MLELLLVLTGLFDQEMNKATQATGFEFLLWQHEDGSVNLYAYQYYRKGRITESSESYSRLQKCFCTLWIERRNRFIREIKDIENIVAIIAIMDSLDEQAQRNTI